MWKRHKATADAGAKLHQGADKLDAATDGGAKREGGLIANWREPRWAEEPGEARRSRERRRAGTAT